MHGLVDLIETADGEQQFVQLVHLDRRVQHFVQREIVDGAMAFDHIPAFAVRADQAAAVNLDLVRPGGSGRTRPCTRTGGRAFPARPRRRWRRRRGRSARENRRRPCARAWARGRRHRERCRARACTRATRGCAARWWWESGALASISKNAGAGRKPLTGVEFQPVRGSRRALIAARLGRRSRSQADDLESFEIFARCVLLKLGQHAADQLGPHGVLLVGVGGVVLLDDVGRGG